MQSRRAVLVAPASDDRKARKALASAADEVVLDLEDAVTPARKDDARSAAAALVAEFGAGRAVSVRINAADTPWHRDDLAMCAEAGPALRSAVVPKAESVEGLRAADDLLGASPARLQILVETPKGVRDVGEICGATDRLEAAIIGYADLAALLGRPPRPAPQTWHAIQDRIVVAARAADIAVVDGPYLAIADDEDFRAAKRWVRDLGFDGTWVIHPAQIAGAQEIFTPAPEAVAEARRVLSALDAALERGAGATELDGQMLDEALAVSARRILARAGTDE